MEAVILGCGEAFDELLPNTSILLKAGTTILLDCGYSAPPQVWRTIRDANEIDTLYISHAHADHYFGVPALLGRMWEEGRTKPLTIVGHTELTSLVRSAMEMGYHGLSSRFKYEIEYKEAAPGLTLESGGVTLRFAETQHAVTNLAVSIEREGRMFFYSGDGMFTDASAELIEHADVAVHEAFSFEKIPVHADIPRLLEMASARSVRQLALVHVQRDLRRNPASIEALLSQSVSMPAPGATLPV
jgi:ribonuclease BN (tRNA processing enzyme)